MKSMAQAVAGDMNARKISEEEMSDDIRQKINMGNYHETPDLEPEALAYRNAHPEINYRNWTQAEEIDAAIQSRAFYLKWRITPPGDR